MEKIPELEELENDGEMKVVEKLIKLKRVNFPAITISEDSIYFNTMSVDYVPQYIVWGSTKNYIVGTPAVKGDRNAFTVRKHGKSPGYCYTRLPSALSQEKKIRPGLYKLYKYGENGIAFKRYEPIEGL